MAGPLGVDIDKLQGNQVTHKISINEGMTSIHLENPLARRCLLSIVQGLGEG